MMRYHVSISWAFAAFICLIPARLDAGVPATEPTTRPVTVAEIRGGGVAGLLGLPLGTMITVTGKAVPNASLLKADEGEHIFLRISAVNGRALSTPVDYPFRKAVSFINVSEPKAGEAFEFRGFETGGFEGVPLNYEATWQDVGFYFRTDFLILPSK